MNVQYYVPTFSSAYGSCNYGTDNFNNSSSTCASGSQTGGGSSSGGGAGGSTSTGGSAGGTGASLTNTGFDVMLAGTLACVIIFSSLIIRFMRRPAQPKSSEN